MERDGHFISSVLCSLAYNKIGDDGCVALADLITRNTTIHTVNSVFCVRSDDVFNVVWIAFVLTRSEMLERWRLRERSLEIQPFTR
jgi:hypothetical protein